MKKTLIHILVEIFVLSFLLILLFFSKECMKLSSNGLLIWFQKMIPSLFPFMILSGFMIKSELSFKFGKLLQPLLGTLFRIPSQMLYVIFMGFLCGFPMGAKIIADMLKTKQITLKEGEFLLAFCNNIGPLYMLGYVIPLFEWKEYQNIFLLMYGIPFLYGIFLRYFSSYKNLTFQNIEFTKNNSHDYIFELQSALVDAIEQITLLGGCMIFFNCLQIFPILLEQVFIFSSLKNLHQNYIQGILCSLLEIGGGLSFFAANENRTLFINSQFFLPLTLSLLTIGGLCCFFQTYLILKKTGLSILVYMKHKLIQSMLIVFFMLQFTH